jgi:prevent-host-death family protein
MTMIMVNIFEAKAKLSDLLDRAAGGERILICKRNQPVAELRPIAAPRHEPRPLGQARDLLTVPGTFFDPLDEADLEAFDTSDVYPSGRSTASRAAERSASVPPARRRGRSSKRR